MTVGPTFTVVTANWNSGDKLRATCDSVLAQGAATWEHLIVDGLSTDGSLGIAAGRAAADARVRVVPGPDRGIYDAMNKGVGAARGRYVYFLGAGDLLLPGAIAAVARVLPPHDRGFVYGDVLWDGRRYDGPFDADKLCRANVCHQAVFYGRDVFRACGGFDLRYRYNADWEMNLRCFGHRRVVKAYAPVVVAHFESGGRSAAGDPAFDADRLRLVRRHLGFRQYVRLRAPGARARLARRLGPALAARLGLS